MTAILLDSYIEGALAFTIAEDRALSQGTYAKTVEQCLSRVQRAEIRAAFLEVAQAVGAPQPKNVRW